jgi:hypothetical protein
MFSKFSTVSTKWTVRRFAMYIVGYIILGDAIKKTYAVITRISDPSQLR